MVETSGGNKIVNNTHFNEDQFIYLCCYLISSIVIIGDFLTFCDITKCQINNSRNANVSCVKNKVKKR